MSGRTPRPSPGSSPSFLQAAYCTIRPRQHAPLKSSAAAVLSIDGLVNGPRIEVSYSTGAGGRTRSPTTVNSAARDTATSSVPWRAPCAAGTTIAATLDATLSHAVLMLHPSCKQHLGRSRLRTSLCYADVCDYSDQPRTRSWVGLVDRGAPCGQPVAGKQQHAVQRPLRLLQPAHGQQKHQGMDGTSRGSDRLHVDMSTGCTNNRALQDDTAMVADCATSTHSRASPIQA